MIISINTNNDIVINIEDVTDQRISLDDYARTITALDILKSKLQDEMIQNTMRTISQNDNNRFLRLQKNGDNNKTVSIKLHNRQ